MFSYTRNKVTIGTVFGVIAKNILVCVTFGTPCFCIDGLNDVDLILQQSKIQEQTETRNNIRPRFASRTEIPFPELFQGGWALMSVDDATERYRPINKPSPRQRRRDVTRDVKSLWSKSKLYIDDGRRSSSLCISAERDASVTPESDRTN